MMHSALIFCERTGAWCTAVRRLLEDENTAQIIETQIIETRSLDECCQALETRPASFLVLEATADRLPTLLSWLARLDHDFPQSRTAVVADRRLAEHEWAVREAGAFAYVTSLRQLQPLVDAVGLFFASQGKPQLTLAERVWNSLPWK